VTRARAAAGIAACVPDEDLAPHARAMRAESRMKGYVATDFPALARGKIRFTGEAVAAALGGFKGVGEGGTIGAPAAVANAIADALAPLGIDITELPMPPDRLFRLIDQREERETP
jgi:carbon-monoxide dehydrogenase large subunit